MCYRKEFFLVPEWLRLVYVSCVRDASRSEDVLSYNGYDTRYGSSFFGRSPERWGSRRFRVRPPYPFRGPGRSSESSDLSASPPAGTGNLSRNREISLPEIRIDYCVPNGEPNRPVIWRRASGPGRGECVGGGEPRRDSHSAWYVPEISIIRNIFPCHVLRSRCDSHEVNLVQELLSVIPGINWNF